MIDGDVRPVALLVGVVNKDKASMSCYQPPSLLEQQSEEGAVGHGLIRISED